MKAAVLLSLAFLSAAVGEAGAAAPKAADAGASPKTVTVHRCVDGQGGVTLQDEPCPAGSQDSRREMLKPTDPPPGKTRAPAPPPVFDPLPEQAWFPPRELIPPPPMYRCTSYDGIQRFSESYDPNPRCEPLVLYYPYPNSLTPAQALGCRWVEDSCVRLSDNAACERWKALRKEAVSAVTRAFSDTAAYRKSELARLSQIVEESCP